MATINGTAGDDWLVGGDEDDTINGLEGHDNLFGGLGDDLLDGGDGNDQLHGDEGNDTLLGGAGNDWFFLETRLGRVLGQDVLQGGSGIDTLVFRGDTDGVTVDAASGTFAGPRPGDGGTLTSIENFFGTSFADSITGDANANMIDGSGGDDTLDGGVGNDTLFGNSGADLLIGGVGDDSLIGGGSGNDTLLGGGGDDILQGSGGNDVIVGDAGNDLIRGSSGNDTLTGSAGADGFFFEGNPHPALADLITDFSSGIDKLRLAASSMPAIGAGGNFTAMDARFHAAPGASAGHDADDRVIYNSSTGELFYDADGSGTGAAQLLATLQGAAALSATDIAVDGGDGPGQVFTGTPGNDSLVGTNGNDTLDGLDGHDTLNGVAGDDVLNGGVGNDSLVGGFGFDHLVGGDGNDVLNGYARESFEASELETDTLDGGSGDDSYFVDNAGDSLSDSGGIDTVWAADMDWTLGAGFENLVVHNDVSESGFTGIGNELGNRISASWAASRLEGRGGNDTLVGAHANGSNFLLGGDGNDSLLGGGGFADSLDGGAGNDTLSGAGGGFVFSAPPGTANADVIFGFNSFDRIRLDGAVMQEIGPSGNFAADDERFHAAAGASGGHDADDRVVYNSSTGQLFYDSDGSGSAAAQLLATLQGPPELTASQLTVDNGTPGQASNGTVGNDSLVGSGGGDTMNGLEGDDTLIGLAGDDVISDGPGNDRVEGGLGHDSIASGSGNDTLSSGRGNDFVTDGGGSDIYVFDVAPGAANSDTMHGFQSGVDKIMLKLDVFTAAGPAGNFSVSDGRFYAASLPWEGVNGHDADDRVIYNTNNGDLWYDADGSGAGAALLIANLKTGQFGIASNLTASDIFIDGGSTAINGTSGADTLTGTDGNDTIKGLGGNDLFLAGSTGGTDVIDGGTGRDSIEFASRATSAVTVDFATGTITGGSSGTINFTGIERVVAGNFNDSLTGNAAAQNLAGQAGADTLWGAGGKDTLWGGGGADTFIFRETGTANADRISDWASGADKLLLDASVMSALGANGNFVTGDARFWSSSSGTAHDADDRVIFNTTTRQVFYDADGNGSGTAQIIATLQTGAALMATDIMVEGGSGGQVINGTEGDDGLVGGDGDDTINGFAGNDTISGLGGNDSLIGGEGADIFVFADAPGARNADSISEFDSFAETSRFDTMRLDATAMPALGAPGRFSAQDARFAANSTGTAEDASDRVILNTSNGQVWYDADGNGAGAAQLIATLQDGPIFTAIDIQVVSGSDTGGRVINGTSGDDTLTGTENDDTIDGLGGNDVLFGNGGADLLRGGDGNDTLWHGDGAGPHEDSVADTLDGGFGDDVYHVSGQDGDVILDDPGGIDTVFAWRSSWTLGPGLENLDLADDVGVASDGTGNELDNRISSASEGGTLLGLGGNDTLVVENAQNTVIARGGDGDDTLLGGHVSDELFGDAGNDLLVSEGGLGDLTGGDGADTFFFNTAPGDDERITDFASAIDTIRLDASVMPALGPSGRFSAGDGRFAANSTGTTQDASDRVVYNTSNGQLLYDADGNGTGAAQLIATLSGAPSVVATDIEVINGSAGGQVINGTSGNDTLTGTAGNDTINGLGGNDLVLAGSSGGADVINGGAGRDSIEFASRATSAMVVDFAAGTITGGSSGTISFTGIERVVAGNFNDSLTGNAAGQNLAGQAGADTLWGAGGVDTLWGGGGADTFIFRETGTSNADSVRDFGSGTDKLLLGGSAMSALGAAGNFAAGDARFKANSTGTATDASDRVLYNTATRQVFYDADGNGSGAKVLIATLQSDATLVATDIAVEGGGGGGQVINGTSGDDSLVGGPGNDTINGFAGNDTLEGLGGNDSLDGGAGNDDFDIQGGDGYGTDTIIGGDDIDWITLRGMSDAVVDLTAGTMTGGGTDAGASAALFGIENLRFVASSTPSGLANLRVIGNASGNILAGSGGNDTLDGRAGNDTLSGHSLDTADFGEADSFLFSVSPGVTNADLIVDFLPGTDKILLDGIVHNGAGANGNFAAGDARFWSSTSGTAHDADDQVIYNTVTGQLWYDSDGSGVGTAQLVATLEDTPAIVATDIAIINGRGQTINGTAGNDTLSGTAGNDTINGLGGNDLVLAGTRGGVDVVDGGAGFDSIEFASRATSALVVDIDAGTITSGSSADALAGTISFMLGVERVVAGSFNDSLTGDAGGQNLTGYAGADTLWGAGGNDTLWGGGGADTFIFRETGSANADRIADWASGSDKVALDNSPMSALGAMGNFAAGDARFWSSSTGTAHDANDRVIYNTSTGSLYYDADGSGGGAAQLIATFTGNPTVAATDITVI